MGSCPVRCAVGLANKHFVFVCSQCLTWHVTGCTADPSAVQSSWKNWILCYQTGLGWGGVVRCGMVWCGVLCCGVLWCGTVRSQCCVMVNLVWCGGWCLRLMCCGSWLMVLVRQCSVVLLEAYDDGACAYWTSIIDSLSIWGPSFLDKKAESCLGNMILSLSGLNDQDWIDGWLRQPKGFQGHRCFVCLDFSVWFHDPYGLDCLDS